MPTHLVALIDQLQAVSKSGDALVTNQTEPVAVCLALAEGVARVEDGRVEEGRWLLDYAAQLAGWWVAKTAVADVARRMPQGTDS